MRCLPAVGSRPGRPEACDHGPEGPLDGSVPAVSSLFGRQPELQALDQLFDDIHEHGGSLTVTGGPGVGKSAVLREAATRAARRGILVLRATGVP